MRTNSIPAQWITSSSMGPLPQSPGNRQSGKFSRAVDLRTDFAKRMREVDADKRAILLGGKQVRRRRRTKAKGTKGTRALAGVIDRRIALSGYSRGYEYKAMLLKSGAVSYDTNHYDSPSAAAAAATGHSSNGWRSWHYRNEQRECVPLKNLRR